MKYPLINREQVNFESDTELCNIGYNEGVLSDERPYRLELWSSYGVLNATIFISSIDLTDKSVEDIKRYIEKEKLIEIIEDKIFITEVEDVEDNKFFSINVPLESNDIEINKCLIKVKDYEF
jgi:hypothetical protein